MDGESEPFKDLLSIEDRVKEQLDAFYDAPDDYADENGEMAGERAQTQPASPPSIAHVAQAEQRDEAQPASVEAEQDSDVESNAEVEVRREAVDDFYCDDGMDYTQAYGGQGDDIDEDEEGEGEAVREESHFRGQRADPYYRLEPRDYVPDTLPPNAGLQSLPQYEDYSQDDEDVGGGNVWASRNTRLVVPATPPEIAREEEEESRWRSWSMSCPSTPRGCRSRPLGGDRPARSCERWGRCCTRPTEGCSTSP